VVHSCQTPVQPFTDHPKTRKLPNEPKSPSTPFHGKTLPFNSIAPELATVSPTMSPKNEPKLLSRPAAECHRPLDQIRPNQTTFFMLRFDRRDLLQSLATFRRARPSQPAPRASNQPCHLSHPSASRRRNVARPTISPIRWQFVRVAKIGDHQLLGRLQVASGSLSGILIVRPVFL
jgi:hypothetical protein